LVGVCSGYRTANGDCAERLYEWLNPLEHYARRFGDDTFPKVIFVLGNVEELI
jgi:hypothetical protein